MKKVLCITTIALLAITSARAAEHPTMNAGEPGNIGIGFQGLFLGNLLSGVAVRGTPAPVGWQVELFQGMIDAEGGTEADLMILKGKGYYALVERENSAMYVGASIGYWMGEVDMGGGDADIDGFSVAPLVGAEWNFAELPELGFNFEVSYEIQMLEIDGGGSDADLDISNVNVSTGIVYYF